jgi:transcription elongation factor GreA
MLEVPFTRNGYERLKKELLRLKQEDRTRISEEILKARELGDLTENAEYHAAKEKQGIIEARIRDLEDKLSRAQVIDPAKLKGNRVVFGATVEIQDLDSGDAFTYQIVGAEESDPKKGRISFESPLARALIGKETGEEVNVQTPRGTKEYEIISVKFIASG